MPSIKICLLEAVKWGDTRSWEKCRTNKMIHRIARLARWVADRLNFHNVDEASINKHGVRDVPNLIESKRSINKESRMKPHELWAGVLDSIYKRELQFVPQTEKVLIIPA